MARKTLLDVLVAEHILTGDAARSVAERAEGDESRVEPLLVEAHVPDADIVRAKSSFYGVPAFRLENNKVPMDVLHNISEEAASHYQVAPLRLESDVLSVGMVRPDDIEAREALKFIASSKDITFKIFVISKSDFLHILEQYKGLGGEVGRALGELESQLDSDQERIRTSIELEKMEGEMMVEDTPVTKIVAVTLKHATEGHASDIHIEPGHDQLRIRFRLDGILYTSLFLPMTIHEAVVARIKILARLKLDEKRKPQDGRFSTRVEDREIDLRVSTFPTYFGEKVVLRILDPARGVKDLSGLGLEGRNLTLVEDALKRPYGMILVTGPTGSGKSTTLYAMLQILNQEKSNVISLEDPVEYSILGVNQSQVRPEIDYTFATGLRSVLRQDPDIIMVGEIRDKETAQLAIHAALTGHLVLSTLHTNNAIGVIPRLIDMGVDPFLISATLVLAIGQRLVRTLCPDSRKEIAVEGRMRSLLEKEIKQMPSEFQKSVTLPPHVYQALPSAICPKGTSGRIGVFEVLSMSSELEQLIVQDKISEQTIEEEARRQSMVTMRQDGILKVLQGRVGLEELSEVVL